ncbi:hypothetical protein TNCV_4409811 [Trichonephila clavipes]|nr:hypothetical protein TNCV_4409811 [Trichonephila clavipes]
MVPIGQSNELLFASHDFEPITSEDPPCREAIHMFRWWGVVVRSWEANSQVHNVKLGGHQTCLSINRLWYELCDMLHRLVGTTATGHYDCSIQE